MIATYPLPEGELRALAPQHLDTYRVERYTGADTGVTLGDFAEPDRVLITRMYAALRELLAVLEQHLGQDEVMVRALREVARRAGWGQLIRAVQQLGAATEDLKSSPRLRKVVHDLRGGGFAALSMFLQFLDLGLDMGQELVRAFFLTRDHMKIMRGLVRDLDEPRYRQDQALKAHGVDLLVEKWDRAAHQLQDRAARVALDCRYDGKVSESCLEFATVDRVLYNLINNAARHTADGTIYFVILPVPEQLSHDLRFVIYNRIDPQQRQTLQARYPDDLGGLFRGGFTTGGTGLGMQICAEIVANAYGVPFERCLEGGYVGARFAGDYFVNWFHWPLTAA